MKKYSQFINEAYTKSDINGLKQLVDIYNYYNYTGQKKEEKSTYTEILNQMKQLGIPKNIEKEIWNGTENLDFKDSNQKDQIVQKWKEKGLI